MNNTICFQVFYFFFLIYLVSIAEKDNIFICDLELTDDEFLEILNY